MGVFRKGSSGSRGLRYKLMLAFSLMSVIPLLACTYIISVYLFPQLKDFFNVSIVISAAVLVAMLGLAFAKALINPVINMAIEANMIASGDYDKKLAVSSDDEVGHLASSINSMTQRIKSNLDELKNYGQKMREVNVEIHKKVIALSSLLQIGDIISGGGSQIDSILELSVEKASNVFEAGFGALYLPREQSDDLSAKFIYNLQDDALSGLIVRKADRGVIGKIMDEKAIIIIDKGAKQSRDIDDFRDAYNIKNALIIPLYSGKKNLGLLIIGNKAENFKYKTDDIDLIKVFAKQMMIAIESDILNKKTEALAIKDDLTDLYNKNFIMARLEEEIKRAIFYQRPCSFIIFNIDGFKAFRDSYGELTAEEVLRRIAKLLKDSATPVGKVARIGGDEFAMLLPEKNKKEATFIAEEIRNKLASTNLLREGSANLTISGGLSENPIDGVTGDELFKKAKEALEKAKALGRNRIIT